MNLSSLLAPRALPFEAAREKLPPAKGYRFLRAYINPWTGVGMILDCDTQQAQQAAIESQGYIAVTFDVVLPKESPQYALEWTVRSRLQKRLKELRDDFKEINAAIDLHKERFGCAPNFVGLSRGSPAAQKKAVRTASSIQAALFNAGISGD